MPPSARPQSENLVKSEVQQDILELIREAGPQGISKSLLARRMNVHQRTIDRAIKLMREAGAEFIPERHGRPSCIHFVYRRAPRWDNRVSHEARLALEVATLALEGPGGDVWTRPLEALRELAEQHLSSKDRHIFETLRSHLTVRGSSDDAAALSPQMLIAVLSALGANDGPRELELTYCAMDGTSTQRAVVPYSLTHDIFSGGTHLLAWDLLREAPRQFRLSRIDNARLTGKRGVIPDKPRLERMRLFQIGGWVDEADPFQIVVKVTGKTWPPHLDEAPPALPEALVQRVRGGVNLSFKATEFKGPIRYILQFGSDAEILDPPELRAAFSQVLKDMISHY